MDKIKKYEKVILKVLADYAAITSPFMPDVENKIIADSRSHHYQLVRMGWYKERHIHYTVFHFEIRDDKVWIHENRTDVKIDEELMINGIAQVDIISGLQHPAMRYLTQQLAVI